MRFINSVLTNPLVGENWTSWTLKIIDCIYCKQPELVGYSNVRGLFIIQLLYVMQKVSKDYVYGLFSTISCRIIFILNL